MINPHKNPQKNIDTVSETMPNRVPVIFCIDNASDDRHLEIDEQVFSGLSKYSIPCRSSDENAFDRICSVNFDPDQLNDAYYNIFHFIHFLK